ncbi:MAG: methylenetetrahydrofolate reductase C-terminal domain-containing protein, partial [bacterium]
MYVMRRWATRNARALEGVYDACARVFHALDPLWAGIGLKRLERPMAAIERWGKGLVFDCRMCGRCVLSSTGMTCPENCPKGLRNGPCGGVRANGTCEVKPAMRCVWVEAWSGAVRMRDHRAMLALQPPRNHAIAGTSAWLR